MCPITENASPTGPTDVADAPGEPNATTGGVSGAAGLSAGGKIAFLGPEGTFTHQALLRLDGGDHHDGVAYASVTEALDAVRSGEVVAALVPIENSVEGGVSATLDNLAHTGRLQIRGEVLLEVQFDLCVRPGTGLGDVRRVLTHPHAAAQCREWLARTLPGIPVIEGGSTAGAAAEVANPDSRFDAAICAAVAGDMYGLDHVATSIADNTEAVTRFVLVATPGQVPPTSGTDKTTMVIFMHQDQPGALEAILDQFASRGVNLCRLESRPTRTTLGNYCFSIDAEGHLDNARVAEALKGLHRTCKDVVFLGSYPRADKVPATVTPAFTDEQFEQADAWLADLRRSGRS